MDLSKEKLDYIRENRHEPPKKLAKAIGVSVRHVDRALRALGDEDALRRARRRHLLASLVGVAALSGVGYLAKRVYDARSAERAKSEAKERELAARKTEKRIYDVLDRHEKGREAEVAPELQNADEGVRLAAVRYLMTDGGSSALESALARTRDPSQRVRLATIQLASDSSSPVAGETLVAIAATKDAELAERTLALSGLRRRPPELLRRLAPKLLDVLTESQEILRRGAHETLARAFPQAKVSLGTDPVALRAAWQNVVEVRH